MEPKGRGWRVDGAAQSYASDMNLANQAVTDGDFFRALQFLKFTARKKTFATQDKPSRDLRGWEWYYLWQQCQGEPQTILGYHADGATLAGFLPDGKTAYSAGNDRMVRLWDIESKKQVGLLEHESAITGCACSLDGRWLATSSDWVPDDRSTLRLWDLRNRNESAVLTTNFWIRPNNIVFALDSKKLAFVDNYKGVRLWNLTPQREITNMPAYFPFSGTLGIAFSPGQSNAGLRGR